MQYMPGAAGIVLVLAMIGAGCAAKTRFVPAPTAQTLANKHEVAVAQAAGVRMEADGKAWSGEPAHLDAAIAPIKVGITNNSGRSLRIRYKDFSLASAGGFTAAALPPLKITGSVPGEPVAVSSPFYGWYGYGPGPYYSPWYPGYSHWYGPFGWDYPYYTTYYAQWPVALPTEDMVRKAIPEGVVNSGGRVEGFLYFPQVPEGAKQATLSADLIDARTGQQFGSIAIPFEVKR
ncbi:MAG: hypothetical protein ACM3S5_18065 [Rhodospirillales bacterium]